MASNKGQYLNQENIIKKVFDETTDALRISVPGGISTKAEQQAQTALRRISQRSFPQTKQITHDQ